jgi:hypothetical protein
VSGLNRAGGTAVGLRELARGGDGERGVPGRDAAAGVNGLEILASRTRAGDAALEVAQRAAGEQVGVEA